MKSLIRHSGESRSPENATGFRPPFSSFRRKPESKYRLHLKNPAHPVIHAKKPPETERYLGYGEDGNNPENPLIP